MTLSLYDICVVQIANSVFQVLNALANIGILILEGQNDSQTPLQQALLLQQRITEANHPDHQIIVYPDLGHTLLGVTHYTIVDV